MENLLLMRKEVDKSLLNEGLTIPQDLHNKFLTELDIPLKKGDTEAISIVIQGETFENVKLYYPQFSDKYSNRDVIQIRYTASQPLAQNLRKIFSQSVNFITDRQEMFKENNKRIVFPEENREFIEIYVTAPSVLEFKCYPMKNKTDEKDVIRGVLNRIFKEYVEAKEELFAKHPLGEYFRKTIPEVFYSTNILDEDKYLVTASVGQGNWANIPWICIFDQTITRTATKGVYIVYLLSEDGKSIYLTFNQGCTDIKRIHTKRETISIMRELAEGLISKINNRGFQYDHEIRLGENLTDLAEYYQEGTIFYKKYEKENLTSEKELHSDLKNMLEIYKDYVDLLNEEKLTIESDGVGNTLSVYDIVEHIKSYIETEGFTYESGLIENLYLSLKSKPFVILAGISGTGKTRLVKLFAEAIGANSTNGRYKMVSVRPDWSDSSDLLGHMNLNGEFIPGTIIDFLEKAKNDSEYPYFLCLDEMNLARVEYYLSDVLSVIETRDLNADGKIVSEELVSLPYYGGDKLAAKKYGALQLPENLYIIGTVNMDETTFPFSRKVLDRANTIEFSTVHLVPSFQNELENEVKAMNLKNSFLKTQYLLLKQCQAEADYVEEICLELETINNILQIANSHVGYRVRDEIVFYLLNNKNVELFTPEDAMDYEIMQKILPRIQGSSFSVKKMLCDLFRHCAKDYDGYKIENEDISSKMINVLKENACKYPRSAEKIVFMVRRYEEDGFTSYWI